MKRFLFTLCAFCTATLAWADEWTDPETGITWTYTLSGTNATITDVSPSTGEDLIFPDKVGDNGGYTVTAIDAESSYHSSSEGSTYSGFMGSLILPKGLTRIGDHAFYGCSFTGHLEIPQGVTEIEFYAFRYCTGITSLFIPDSVTTLDAAVFEYCTNLQTVEYLNKMTSIPNWTFNGCSSLTSITIPSSVTSIGPFAFSGCSSLTSVTIPEGVTTIGESAFSGCSSLTSVTIPEGVTTIGESAFYDCSSLTSVKIPESVTRIGRSAFENCLSLTSIAIPEGVTSIEWGTFWGCSSLTSVTILKGLTSIGEYAFYGCSSLTSITIPSSVTSIGGSTFRGCSGLTSFSLPASVMIMPEDALPPSSTNLKTLEVAEGNPIYYTNAEKTLLYNNNKTKLLRVAKGSIKGPVELEPTVMIISNDAFSGCSGLTSITIPESVTSIGWNAFDGCSGLQAVHMKGPVPNGFVDSGLRNYSVAYPKKYGAAYKAVLGASSSYVGVIATAGVKVSAEMTKPKTMKVTYTVESDLPTVKVRAVAFADGVRSFAKIVPVKSGENVPLGGEVATNTEHTFVWNVSKDWETELSKVAIEILVQEGALLPQELITIPAIETHREMTITLNTLTSSMSFNALLWCVAEGDEDLTISNGVVRANGTQIASGTGVSNNDSLLNYLYGKMGYKVLSGNDLTYARSVTRINFPSSGIEQRAIKIED